MMTLEERADFIAGASGNMPSGTVWKRIRERALQQLREAAAESWRAGYSSGIAAQGRGRSPASDGYIYSPDKPPERAVR